MSPWGLRASEGIILGAVASLIPSVSHRSSGPCWPGSIWPVQGEPRGPEEASGTQSGTGYGL